MRNNKPVNNINIVKAASRFRVAIVALTLLVTACDYKPPVEGQEDLLVIIVSDEDRSLLQPLLMNVFGREMLTPSAEPYFKVVFRRPDQFAAYKKHKSLVVASLANPADSTGDHLTRVLLGDERALEAEAGGNPIFISQDLFARGQMFMGLLALDAIHAHTELERLGDWIFDQFETQLRHRQSAYMFRNGDNHELSDSLEVEFGWNMRLELDYVRIKERPQFVWLGRGYPYRWLSVTWIEGADSIKLDKQWAWRQMEHIAEDLFRDIYIDSMFRSEQLGMENGHSIYMLKGVVGHKTLTAGGPFITYIFRDRKQNRIYIVSGMVFHPGGSKGLLIKRQEIMMRTFHTFEQPPVSSGAGKSNLTDYRPGQQRNLKS